MFLKIFIFYPEKFNNKTNGIAQRRWSQIANPSMSALLDKQIGDGQVFKYSWVIKIRGS